MVRKMLAEMQPFRKIVRVDRARDCSKIDILLFTEQPFRKIVRVDRAKLKL